MLVDFLNNYDFSKILDIIIKENKVSDNSLNELSDLLIQNNKTPDYLDELINKLWMSKNQTLNNELKKDIFIVIRKLNNENYVSDNITDIGSLLVNVIQKFPEIKSIMAKELKNFNIDIEELPYLNDLSTIFLGSIGTYTYKQFKLNNIIFVKDIFKIMEDNYNKSEKISDAIATGFVEAFINPITDKKELNYVFNLMGNNLREYAEAYIKFWETGKTE